MKKMTALMSVAALAGVSTTASADVANFIATEVSANTWQIYVDITGGDSGGLASYGFNVVDLANPGSVSYTDNVLGNFNLTFQPTGFADDIQATLGADAYTVSQSQTAAANPAFNVGVAPVLIEGTNVIPGNQNIDLADPALLGTLTVGEALDASNFQFTATLFNDSGNGGTANLLGTQAFTITSTVTPVPEPGSLALLGLGGLLIARRRRG